MRWREDLGDQIRRARVSAGLTQLQLAQKAAVKREHISNIELGKNSPAVKIVTDIAKALNTRFQLEGCWIEPSSDRISFDPRPVPVPKQLSLDFGVEHRFNSQSISLTAHSATELELRAILSRRKRA
ncbi:MAG: helix-turn-helix transcriptional regulator [Terracidiphilus sp.]